MVLPAGSSSPKTIVVGVSGGIAAYKAVALVRLLVLRDCTVHVVPTHSALRFVGEPTWEAISRRPVVTDVFSGASEVPHVRLAREADLVLIAPATAHTLAKLALGFADDALTSVVLATKAPVMVAPTMHTEMWEHPATQANVERLRQRGVQVIEPAVGALTGGDVGEGRMQEPDVIASRAFAALNHHGSGGDVSGGELQGQRIVVTAGGTREPIDPVRFIGNRSSGKQGVALAREAARRGAAVTLVAANVESDVLAMLTGVERVRIVPVSSAAQLEEALLVNAPDADIVFMAAAVADYRPAAISEKKLKKVSGRNTLNLELETTPDLLQRLVASRTENQVIVGFAAETEADPGELVALARSKVRTKNVDYLVVNRVGWTEGISSDMNTVTMLDNREDIVMEASGTKLQVAQHILDALS